jgi:hypothetical protein
LQAGRYNNTIGVATTEYWSFAPQRLEGTKKMILIDTREIIALWLNNLGNNDDRGPGGCVASQGFLWIC